MGCLGRIGRRASVRIVLGRLWGSVFFLYVFASTCLRSLFLFGYWVGVSADDGLGYE